jgi:O-antigen ligase
MRADVLGQVLVRAGAWAVLIACILLQDRSTVAEPRPVFWLALAALALVVAQVVPLPPIIWQALPGRAILAQTVEGAPVPYRPLAIVPGAAINAASSLVVPFAVLFGMAGLRPHERRWIFVLILGLIVVSMLIGLVQFSGVDLRNPLLNGDERQVSGLFANRNHFALFMAMGCVMAPVWAFPPNHRSGWRLPVLLGLLALFLLMILATGSRAGLVLGGVGLVLGGMLVWPRMRRQLSRYPRWVLPLGGVLLMAGFVTTSVVAGRAASIDRLFAMDQAQDMRTRALPTVLGMIGTYFPVGSGFGGFDPIFRIHEPFELLKTTYFNHAHNDFLEIVLDGGLPAALLLAGALAWWGYASFRALRLTPATPDDVPPLLGSALLLLLCIASLFDYPARTPMMMAMIIIAAIWLAQPRKEGA